MKFSICIPNYNYGQYIGETIQSVISQDYENIEVIISDNQSTDNSWQVIQEYAQKDPRVKAFQNLSNLGFAGNLDVVSAKATGDYHLLVSSDDLINPGALAFYARFIEAVGQDKIAFSASTTKVDSTGNFLELGRPNSKLWKTSDQDETLSNQFGCPVYKVASGEMLRRCLLTFYGPFMFVSACYRAEDYLAAGGYGGSRMMNPDKWFHWRLLGQTDYVYFIDKQLFSYRWHDTNQTAQQKSSGALKFFLDEYRSSFETSDRMLAKAGLNGDELKRSFIYNSICKYTFSYIKLGQIRMGWRVFRFGWACYPDLMWKNKYAWLLYSLLLSGKLGTLIVKPLKANYVTGK